MKKLLFFAGVLSMLAITSCNKEVTCECTVTTTVEGSEPTTTMVTYTSEQGCEGYETSVTTEGITSTTTCVEK